MTQEHLAHQAQPETIVLFVDRKQAPRVFCAAAAVAAAAEVVCRMMQTERVASLGAQHVYQVHDGIELGVLVHVDFVRNRVNVIEWSHGTDLGEKIVENLELLGYHAECYQIESGSYLYMVLSGHCPIFDQQAVVLACLAAAECDDLAA